MKSSCLGADRNYTKPISHCGDLNNQTEQSSGSCQQVQIPSLKGPAPCIISRERLRLHSLHGKLRCDQKLRKYSHFMEGKYILGFKVFFTFLVPVVTFPSTDGFCCQWKMALFLTGWKDSLPRPKRCILHQTIQNHNINMTASPWS